MAVKNIRSAWKSTKNGFLFVIVEGQRQEEYDQTHEELDLLLCKKTLRSGILGIKVVHGIYWLSRPTEKDPTWIS